jgi:hypothetical protein
MTGATAAARSVVCDRLLGFASLTLLVLSTNQQRAREAMGRLYCCDCLEVLEEQRKQPVAVLLPSRRP